MISDTQILCTPVLVRYDEKKTEGHFRICNLYNGREYSSMPGYNRNIHHGEEKTIPRQPASKAILDPFDAYLPGVMVFRFSLPLARLPKRVDLSELLRIPSRGGGVGGMGGWQAGWAGCGTGAFRASKRAAYQNQRMQRTQTSTGGCSCPDYYSCTTKSRRETSVSLSMNPRIRCAAMRVATSMFAMNRGGAFEG